jgi:hypothetical protein
MKKYKKLENINDIDLFIKFKKDIINSKNIILYFELYTKNFTQIKDLYIEKLDKSEATKIKIQSISKKSHFSLSIKFDKEEDYFSFFGHYSSDDDNKKDLDADEQEITLEELNELRARAMLAKKLIKDKSNEENKMYELNQQFSERVSEINKIKTILNKIAMKGYTEDIIIAIDIIDSKPYYGYGENDFKDFKECIKYLNEILDRIIETQIYYYKKNEYIRYIYGRQFNLLNISLKRKGIKYLDSFLKYFSNDMIYSLELDSFKYNNELVKNDKYKCLLENCSLFLSEFLYKNGISLEMILEQNKIKQKFKNEQNENEFVGLYTYLLEGDDSGGVQKGLEEHILNWYHFLTDNPPMAQTLLLCNEETTSEEITAFLYRAFLCPYNIVFMIGKIELLSSKITQTLTGLINTLYIGHEKEMKSCLVFAYTDKTANIVKYLETIKGHEILKHNDKKKK